MTKAVRIENADTSAYRLRVYIERKNETGEWVRGDAPIDLDYPTAMCHGYVWQGQRLVVEES